MIESREANQEEIAATGLSHRVHIPETGGKNRPLVVLVHGRAGNSNVMWVFAKAFRVCEPVILTPQAFLSDPVSGASPKGEFSWWPVREKLPASADAALRAERLAEVEAGVLRVKDFITRAAQFYGTNPEHTFAAGFSQGAALVATLSLIHPEMLQGVALLAGFIPYAVVAEPGLVSPRVRSGEAALPPYFVAHGSEDPVIPISRAHETVTCLKQFGADVTMHEDTVPHKIGTAGIRALEDWVAHKLWRTQG